MSDWRLTKKMEPLRPYDQDKIEEAPFGTDPECDRILSRADLTNQIDKMINNNKKKSSYKKVDVEKLLGQVVDELKAMEMITMIGKGSPRTEKAVASKQIASVRYFFFKLT